jgi:hypothetical protein
MLIRELILETRDLAAQASFWAKTLALPTAVSEQSVEVRQRCRKTTAYGFAEGRPDPAGCWISARMRAYPEPES